MLLSDQQRHVNTPAETEVLIASTKRAVGFTAA